MPLPGLSLFGFMDEPAAANYLRTICVVAAPSDAALRRLWQDAKARLGPPMANAGHPDIQEIPPSHLPYLQGVLANPRFADTVGALPWGFKLIEADPLLAFQVHVSTTHAPSPGGGGVPDMTTMLQCCLPHNLESAKYQLGLQTGGFLIRSPDLNLRTFQLGGPYGHDPARQLLIAGLVFGVSSPLVQVVRFNGRCYLKNGFHRVYGLGMAGATHVPCLLIEASDWARDVAPGGGFGLTLLESADPPTCAHYTQGRAYAVTMRTAQRVIDVKVSESVALEP